MVKVITGILMGGLILGTVAVACAGPFTRREARQQDRIDQGVRNDRLIPWEFAHLEREQAAIEAHRRMAWSDGRLSPWEARQLTREQNRASRDIWRSNNNAW